MDNYKAQLILSLKELSKQKTYLDHMTDHMTENIGKFGKDAKALEETTSSPAGNWEAVKTDKASSGSSSSNVIIVLVVVLVVVVAAMIVMAVVYKKRSSEPKSDFTHSIGFDNPTYAGPELDTSTGGQSLNTHMRDLHAESAESAYQDVPADGFGEPTGQGYTDAGLESTGDVATTGYMDVNADAYESGGYMDVAPNDPNFEAEETLEV